MQTSSLTLENNAPEVYYAKFKFKDENVPPSYIVFETKKESQLFSEKIKVLIQSLWPENSKHFITFQATLPKPVSK